VKVFLASFGSLVYISTFIDLTGGLIAMLTSSLPRDPRLKTLAGVLIAKEQQTRALLAAKWFRISEVATALSCNPATIRRWITSGELKASRTGPTGRWRISEAELLRLQGKVQ
jgi:excisionase family DNA binding protein